ncbi:MAG: hypothetical protein ACJ79E_13735, partial [Anaeromyxobacteraceae bacterium]
MIRADRDAGPRAAGLELRLERGSAHACLPAQPLAGGVELVELSLAIPDAPAPVEVALGAAQFRHRLCTFERLEVVVGDEALASLVARLDLASAGIASLAVATRAGFLEGSGALHGGVPFTFKAALLPSGGREVELFVHEARLYAPSDLPAFCLARRVLGSGGSGGAAGAPGREGGAGRVVDPLPLLLRRLLPSRGWKVPRLSPARLAAIELSPGALRLAWDASSPQPVPAPDGEVAVALDGHLTFADAERLAAAGELLAARGA